MGTAATADVTQDNCGIIPTAIRAIFSKIYDQKTDGITFKTTVQFIEIYDDQIFDLLLSSNKSTSQTSKKPEPVIRETKKGDVFVDGAKEFEITSLVEAMDKLQLGITNRQTSETKMNKQSSRSHAIFVLNIEQTIPLDGGKYEKLRSKFYFADLAGSESIKRTAAEGQQMKEAIGINQGLSSLGNVIRACANKRENKNEYVNYRDSKLTRILQVNKHC